MRDLCVWILTHTDAGGHCGRLRLSTRPQERFRPAHELGPVYGNVMRLLEPVLGGLVGMRVSPPQHYFCFDSSKPCRGDMPSGEGLGGESLDLAYFIAAFSLAVEVLPREHVACTGILELSGTVSPVGELPAKLKGAANSGVVNVVVLSAKPWDAEYDKAALGKHKHSLKYVEVHHVSDLFRPSVVGGVFDVASLREFLGRRREQFMALDPMTAQTDTARKILENLQACARAPFSIPDPFDRSVLTLERFLGVLREQGADVEHDQYRHLEEVFVPPREYGKILETLRNARVVFILGPPHVGKTYIAANLLWHYYRESRGGRDPRWLLPRRESEQGTLRSQAVIEPEMSLEDLVALNVGKHTVTYVEDPLGRVSCGEVRWRRSVTQDVVREVVRHAQNDADDARLIITSRDVLFDKIATSLPALQALVVRLGRRPDPSAPSSYGAKEHSDLLAKYACLHSCAWYSDRLPKEFASQVQEELATPKAVARFCELSKGAGTHEDCYSHLEIAARELVNAFRDEILTLDGTMLAFAVAAGCAVWANAGFIRFRDFIARGYPHLSKRAVGEMLAAADEALGHRLLLEEYMGGRPRFAYKAYLSALDAVCGVPRGHKLLNDILSALAQASEDSMDSVVADLLVHVATTGNLNESGYDTLRALLRRGGRALLVIRGLAPAWERLDERCRAELQVLIDDKRSDVIATTLVGSLASQFVHLDSQGRALLKEVVRRGNCFCRLFVTLLALRIHRLDDEGRQLVREMSRDPDKGVLTRLMKHLEQVYRREQAPDLDATAILETLAGHEDQEVSGRAAGLLKVYRGEAQLPPEPVTMIELAD